MIKRIFSRAWDSPTLMTWMSYSTKALSLFIVLPLILKNFSAAEVSLYYLFTAIITLMSLADFGFKSTFSRIISYAFGGATDVGIYRGDVEGYKRGPNWELIERISSNMNRIYFWLSGVLLILFATLGSWSLLKPISQVTYVEDAWLAWYIIIATSVLKFYGTVYQNYLEGLFKIALVRRIESLMQLGAIFTSIAVLIFGGGILELVIAMQVWQMLNIVRNRYLARIVEGGQYKRFKAHGFDKLMFGKIWQPAWRSGISGIMSNGLTQLTGLLYAQFGDAPSVASYLLALRIITQIKEVSMAPFYSKIPLMARFRVEGKLSELVKIAQKGMFLGHTVFVAGIVFVTIFLEPLLLMAGSNVSFVSNEFWLLLSLAFYIHRYGAMHMQLYLTTNHVVSHIADSVSGILFIASVLLLKNEIGLFAFPIGMLVGYLGFYAWYAASYSLKSLSIRFFEFEKKASIPSSLALLTFLCIIIVLNK
jgi:hypothetical protein